MAQLVQVINICQVNIFNLCDQLLKPMVGDNSYIVAAKTSRKQDIFDGMESLQGSNDYYPSFQGVTALLISAWDWQQKIIEVCITWSLFEFTPIT